MRKLIFTALVAAAALPALAPNAMAQSNQELQRDRQDIRKEKHDVQEAQRHGTPGDVREQRAQLADARREYHDDARDARNRAWHDNDWQDWRQHNREEFRRGSWNAPFRYSVFSVGGRIAPVYYSPRYVIVDPWRYHLPRPASWQRWVRHYNDVLLIDMRRGVVIRVLRNFYW
jgi:Ni/Co efflux regulator RcnB